MSYSCIEKRYLLEFNIKTKGSGTADVLLERIYYDDDEIFDMRFNSVITNGAEAGENKAGGSQKGQNIK